MRRAETCGVAVVRRRGGGGAVALRPGDHLWIDCWVPRGDPLWVADISAAAAWVGSWWVAALGGQGVDRLEVHAGRAAPGELGGLVCFAGRGPGEVFAGGRKLVGLSQWRSREGALFSSCAYAHWDPAPLVELLAPDDAAATGLLHELTPSVVGVRDLVPAPIDLGALRDTLVSSFPGWAGQGAPASG
jgi:lipoate-protein ligase A